VAGSIEVIGESWEGYARLPEDLLQELLQNADEVVAQVSDLLGPTLGRRDELREKLQELGLIRTYTQVEPATVCGVDGGFAIERTSAVDLMLSVAVGVEGLSNETTPWGETQYLWWSRVYKHDPDAERLARGVMIAQELAIIGNAPHSIRILDGSHLTLVIQLNSAMSSFSDGVRSEARRVWDDLATREMLTETVSNNEVVAMPKYDSSREICDELSRATGEDVPGDDKYLLSFLLDEGELLVPRRVPDEWALLHFTAPTPADVGVRDAFVEAIRPLRERRILFTYFKAEPFSPAYRIEMKEAIPENRLDEVCSTIARQITGPFVREPFPQYLADVMAKSVGLGLGALKTAVQLGLGAIERPDIAELLVQSYRTEGA
jgi:hypothetical protein